MAKGLGVEYLTQDLWDKATPGIPGSGEDIEYKDMEIRGRMSLNIF